MKKKSKNWMILFWVLASVVYALVIHVLFSLHPVNQWFIAKWSAGEILTYASTISLGLLAVWQNNKFQEENDRAQERLQHIIEKSNELEIMGKIVEYESANLNRLRTAFGNFSEACDPQRIISIFGKTEFRAISLKTEMVFAEAEIDKAFYELGRELRIDKELKDNDENALKKAYKDYYIGAKELVTYVRDNTDAKDIGDKVLSLSKRRDIFLGEREKYIVQQEKKLNTLLYENLSIEEIKQLYHRENGLGD